MSELLQGLIAGAVIAFMGVVLGYVISFAARQPTR